MIRKLLCLLGFHKASKKASYDGHKVTSNCQYCGKELTMDDYGNWY